MTITTQDANKIFGVRLSAATKNGKGEPIKLEVLPPRTDGTEKFLAKADPHYVFPIEDAVSVAIALDGRVREPVLLWGLHGSGKSTLAEQVCEKTGRPCIRVQHSVDTEASDIVGQWTLTGDKTEFVYGPLARAMRDGLVYIADEYDFALPNVLAVYQAVLEGNPLFIKQAPEDMAIVAPHKDFRFMATGNTNGSGDETGLYQGTQIQNAANYSRFGVTIKLDYQKPEAEKEIITRRVGAMPAADMDSLMEFVKLVRNGYDDKSITNTISTREIIKVARFAILRGKDGPNWDYAVKHAFTNRMSSIDAGAINNLAQRVFGK
jgi:cobaltochelatase CobS